RTPTIGYVVKGYPRLSELFIASEIHRLERAGLGLRLFAIKAADEAFRHSILDRIEARTDYLPATESVSGTPLWRWLPRHARRFAGPLLRTLAQWPIGVGRGALAALAQAVRARERFCSPPRKVYVKEFLQAVAIADRLRGAPDIRHLHAHFCHGATTVTWLAASISGRTFSFTAHAKDIYTPSLNPAGLLARKLAAARFAVTCTEANRVYLEQYAGRTPVYRVYHGLNAEFAEIMAGEPARPQTGASDAVLRIVAVGRHVHKKGFDVLIDACANLAAQGVLLEATIIGESGDQTHALADRIARCGLADRVRLPRPLPQRALLGEYRRATVFCLPCRVSSDGDRDGIPNVLVEAMASGLPVVTTEVSGIPELVENDRNGLLVPPDDAVATAAALLRIFRDRALAERLAANGRAVVAERFDGDRLIGELAMLFRRVA
ncbi:MAG TPA: glycosyltransferase family 4 protein, partial [Vicinamibacterales bacterium]|nr:glycosyltransferase family 4 protein [Vicinamibacterales bacterium]